MPTYLVCEGDRDAIDVRVLEFTMIQLHNLKVVVAPTGGDKGLGAVRAFLESPRTPQPT